MDLSAWTAMTGQTPWSKQLIPGSLFHNLYSNATYIGLFFGQTVYLMERFDEGQALELIEKHGIQFIGLAPTMMDRMMRHPSFQTRNLESLEAVFHSGGPCPDKVKLAWIERVGARKVYEMYGETEMIASTFIRGEEWLEPVSYTHLSFVAICSAVLSPVVASIIASNGWRMGYIVLGVLALVIVIPAVLIWFRTPEQKGQLPLGATEADIEAAKNADPKAAAEAAKNLPGLTSKQALKTPTFWFFFIFMVLLTGTLAFASIVPTLAIEAGFDTVTSGFAMTAYMIGTAIAAVVFGTISDLSLIHIFPATCPCRRRLS